MITASLLMYVALMMSPTRKGQPYQQGPTIICDIYPAPNGGFFEKCRTVSQPAPLQPVDRDPAPMPQPEKGSRYWIS